ncbi:MAG TPA: hypothetical protein VFG69_13210, partial [Nannocystaceae bacterium]|nr:hypothetical protein [Nannocystaceae bacterium]
MKARPRPHRWLRPVVAALVAVTLAAPAVVHAAPEADSAEAERLMAAAETALDEGRQREAGELLARAHRSLPASLRVGAVGKSVVLHAADAYEAAWLASDDVADLDAAIALLTEHNAAPDARDETVQRELARLQVLRARLVRAPPG